MQVRYLDEFKWVDTAEGTAFQFQDQDGESVADVAVHDPDLKLWKWIVHVPARYRYRDVEPCGVVVGHAAAKRVCELILLNTFVTKPAGFTHMPR
jgi:hypothetical protein